MEAEFIGYVNDHYGDIQTKIKMLCGRNKQRYDEDLFHEAILRCHKAIAKKGTMYDSSPRGMEGYLIRSYFNLVKEEQRSCRVAKRDLNYQNSVPELYENWYNKENSTSLTKVVSDLYKDFATLYVVAQVEQHFDQEHFYLFKLKYLCEMTYKQVCQKAQVRDCRSKILEVKAWLKDNVTKEDVTKAFQVMYGDLL